MAKSNKRRTQEAPGRVSVEAKRARKPIVEELAKWLIDLQAKSHSHKEIYGEFGAMVKEKQNVYEWLTKDMVRSKKKRILAEQKKKATATGSQQEEHAKEVGRRKGSTKEAAKDLSQKKVKAKVMLQERYATAKAASEQRVAPGTFDKLHDEVLEELELNGIGFSISKNTIKHRVRKNITATKPGPVSPAAAIEPLLLTIIQYRLQAGQPLTQPETIAFANSLIQGSEVEESLIDFHRACGSKPTQTLGKRWFKGFMRRHEDILKTGRGSKQDRARKEWTTYENVQQMYTLVYEQMVKAGIAEQLPESEHYWVDKEGQIVDSEDKAAGHKCTIRLTHPEYLLFGDEVGTDTAQDQDGHNGGETYIKFADGTKVELLSTKATGRFTVMGLTAASGDPVMCIVIIAGKELGVQDYMGFDHQAESPYDGSKTLEENAGPGMALPEAPECVFRGKKVPGMIAVSPKGSMTSDILKKALKTLDDLGVYPRTLNGPTPMCLFDGHDSRLQIPFLEYINSYDPFGKPMWRVCIGLPNGTAKWQVGDSVQQNGSFKMAMTREKRTLVAHKNRYMFASIDIKHSDSEPA
ncbi:unnamed protein product [Cylindrotheca closterium]|uniref:Uncharacterized protein n=1 Tax=Cylindrotheca closterium TaxID=2856 RepID=A0AAD2G9A4_9STRA|nr:unnamed protein product [Cylindrotheca closterium]